MPKFSDLLPGILEGFTGQVVEQQKSKREQHQKVEQLQEAERLHQTRPDQRTSQLVLDQLLNLVRQPSEQDIQRSIPQGTIAVPGPQGSVVMGQGQVAPGTSQAPGALEALQMFGLGRAQQQLEPQRAKSLEILQLLSRMGVGTLSQPRVTQEDDPIVQTATDADTGERVAITQSGQVIPLQ